jgi:hypothetical protein
MPKAYFTYLPEVAGRVEEEWNQCLNQIVSTLKKGYTAVKLNIFVDLPDYSSFLKIRSYIVSQAQSFFGSTCPALNITVHPPEKPFKAAVEATFIPSGSGKVTGKSFNSLSYIVLESDKRKEVWAGGVSSYNSENDTREAANKAFNLMIEILNNEGMTPDNLVRQWNYIGNILSVKDGLQNYQIFNEVRYDYYSRFRKIHGFPAATGVGMKHGGVILDFCAVSSDISLKITPVENPNQVNAYSYGQQVLKGSVDKGKDTKHPPQFERALLLVDEQEAKLHISGTASIRGQETIGINNTGEQTKVTIENIRKLSDAHRLNRFFPDTGMNLTLYSLIRVYIKSQNDFGIVKKICREEFPGVSSVFVEADICRDDLLMEIEAEAALE